MEVTAATVIEGLVLLPYPLALTWAMCSDLTRLRIPNAVTLVLVGGFLIAAPVHGLGLEEMALQIGFGLAALAIGIVLFAFGAIGGGDAKLLAGTVLWVAPAALPEFLIWVPLCGGILAAVVLVFRRLPIEGFPRFKATRTVNEDEDETATAKSKNRGKPRTVLPYGVAIGCAGIITLPNLSVFAS